MKNRSFKLIIFDLDGTLIDSLEDIADAANRVLLEAHMVPHPVTDYRYFVGDGLSTLIQRIAPDNTSKRRRDELAARFKMVYQGCWNQKTKLYTGIRELLNCLKEAGVSLNILSNKPDGFTRLCVKEFFPDMPFDQVLGQRDKVPLKPHPQAVIEMLDKAGISPQSSLFVGDTAIDIKTGKSAGMTTVGVTWGFRPVEELQATGADIIITKPEELNSHVHHSS